MALEIRGTSYHYTFPVSFDYADHARSRTRSTRVAFGRDGGIEDNRQTALEPVSITVMGLIQATSVNLSKVELDSLLAAVTSLPEDAYLVDTTLNRGISVRMRSIVAPREPARRIPVTVAFVSNGLPFWEDLTETLTKGSNTQWLDISTGDAPVKPRMVVVGGVNIANPTIVKGNFNFVSHVGLTQASAINSRQTASVWGTVIGNIATSQEPEPSRYGFGRLMAGATFTFSSLVCRPEKFSAMVRFEGRSAWPSVVDFTLMDFNVGDSSTGSLHYELKINGATMEFGNSVATIFGTAPAYSLNQNYSIAAVVDTSLSTGKAKLYSGQTLVASKATFSGSPQTLTKLWIGTNRLTGNPCRQLIDEVYIWHQAQGKEYIQGLTHTQRQVIPDNQKFAWSSSVQSNDWLDVDHATPKVDWIVGTTQNRSSRFQHFTGDFIELATGRGFGKDRVETVYSNIKLTTHWRFKKRWY